MSFDAGAITGGLHFDMSEFAHGMLQAEAVSRAFPPIVVDFIENPLAAISELAKKAGESIYEAFEGTGHLFDDMGREALKAGMNVQAFSSLLAAAKPDAIGLEQFSTALAFMQERAAAAMQGDDGAIKAFKELGITMGEVSGLMKDPEAMLYRLSDAFKDIPIQGDRVKAAMELMSRSGKDMLPFLQRGSEEIRHLASEMAELGGAVNEHEAHFGELFAQMEGKFDSAWTGIKKAVAEPILQVFADHWKGIDDTVKEVSKWAQEGLGTAIKGFMDELTGGSDSIRGLGNELKVNFVESLKDAGPAAASLLKDLVAIGAQIGPVIVPALESMGRVARDISDTFGPFLKDFTNAINQSKDIPGNAAEISPILQQRMTGKAGDVKMGDTIIHVEADPKAAELRAAYQRNLKRLQQQYAKDAAEEVKRNTDLQTAYEHSFLF